MRRFFKSVDKVLLGSVTAVFVLLISILCWIFKSDDVVPMWLYIVTMILCYLVCVIVYAVCKTTNDDIIYRLPVIKSIQEVNGIYVFIVEKNDLFNQGSYATICFQEDDENLEIVLGIGYVQSINSAGYLQIVIENLSTAENVTKIYNEIENTAFYRKSIKIKPSIDRKLLEEAISNG